MQTYQIFLILNIVNEKFHFLAKISKELKISVEKKFNQNTWYTK